MTASMPHRLGLGTVLLGIAVLGACEKEKFPPAEVTKPDVKLELPAVPAFDLPPQPADGSHTIKELRVKGRKLLESDISVHGFITWAYDCPTAVRKPNEDDKALQKRLDDDPTLCERAKFYIGDAKDTPAEKSLWVTDVPRPYNKLEMERIKKPERNFGTYPDRCEPNEKDVKKAICPPYTVGDEVEITGSFKVSSPHSERNSDGLLVYKKMKNITQNWESPVIELPPPGPGAPPPPPPANGKVSPEKLVKPKKP